MSAGKFSIFVTVVSLHACVLGIVYVSTRKPVSTAVSKKQDPAAVKGSKATATKKSEEIKTETVSSKQPGSKINPVRSTRQVSTHAQPSDGKYRIHTVGPNDYLGKIASKYKVSSKSIIKLNGIKDPNRINRGQKLKIPVN